jgi:hypothetical protein
VPLHLPMTHRQFHSIAVQRFDSQAKFHQVLAAIIAQLALVQYIGDGKGSRQSKGARDQFSTLKINRD